MPLSDFEKIDVIANERSGLRAEINDMKKAIVRCAFLFMTISIGIVGLYFDHRIIQDPTVRTYLLLALTQFELFLAMLVLCMFFDINNHAGYIEALEEKINLLSGETINIWESEITKKYMFNWKSGFFWIIFVLVLMLLIIFINLFDKVFDQVEILSLHIIFFVEISAFVLFFIWSNIDRSRIKSHAEKKFNINA